MINGLGSIQKLYLCVSKSIYFPRSHFKVVENESLVAKKESIYFLSSRPLLSNIGENIRLWHAKVAYLTG